MVLVFVFSTLMFATDIQIYCITFTTGYVFNTRTHRFSPASPGGIVSQHILQKVTYPVEDYGLTAEEVVAELMVPYILLTAITAK